MPHADDKTIEQFRKTSKEIDELFSNGKKKEGTELLERVLSEAKEKDDAYALFFEGEIQGYIHEDYLKQEDFFKKAIEFRKEDGFLIRNLGVSLSIIGGKNKDEAVLLFDKAIALNPNDYMPLREKGLFLSEKGDQSGAIALYDKALEINPNDFGLLRDKGAALFNGDDEDGAIVLYDKALQINPNDYKSIRFKGVSLLKKGEEVKAVELFDRALKINPDDFNLYRDKGVALSKQGDEDGAIALFDKALELNPKDYNSWREKGVSLSKQGDEAGAIVLFDKALELNPKDYNAWRQKGVSLSKKGDATGAISLYDKAIELNPKDFNSFRSKGITLSNLGDYSGANKMYEKALDIKPKGAETYYFKSIHEYNFGHYENSILFVEKGMEIDPNHLLLKRIASFLKERFKGNKILTSKMERIVQETPKLTEEQHVNITENIVAKVQNLMGTVFEEFIKKMDEKQKHLDGFIEDKRKGQEDGAWFHILRKWNSYTPILPADGVERSVGGGYFLQSFGKGIVIDPGFGFIENFCKAGFRVDDIDAVVVTHAHNDHNSDLESLLTLFYKHKKKNKEKMVDLYLNTGSLIKFSGLLNIKGSDYIGKVHTLMPDHEYKFNEQTKLKVLKAYHDEVITKDYAVGLWFKIKGSEEKNVIISSDTGLYPPSKENDGVDVDPKTEIWKTYGIKGEKINLLVPHLGSIKEQEFKKKYYENAKEMFYKNHLGILGVAVLITQIEPELAVISEFGEELCEIQEGLVNLIEKVITDTTNSKVKLLPGDIGFIYDILSGKVCCQCSGEIFPPKEIEYTLSKKQFYFYNSSKLSDIGPGPFNESILKWEQKRRNGELCYHKQKNEPKK